MYSKYQFEDVKLGWSKAKGKWHVYGALMRMVFVITFVLQVYFPAKVIDILLAAALNLPLWDIGINKIALRYKWNYMGSISHFDRIVGKWKWVGYVVLIITLTLIEILFYK